MTAQIIKILATSKTPRYRPLPTEPATVILMPMMGSPQRPRRSTQNEPPPPTRARKTIRPVTVDVVDGAIRVRESVERKVRASIGDLEATMRKKYRLDAAADRNVDKPCDT